MSDSIIQLPADGPGKKLDTEQLVVGANTVERERDRIAGAGAAELAEVKTEALSAHHGLVVRPIDITSPTRDVLSSAGLAAGASETLDGTVIANTKIGKLMGVTLASSAPGKWEIQKWDGAVALTLDTVFTGGFGDMPTFQWKPPNKRFATQDGNGVDKNFRVVVTNLHAVDAADFYTSLYWDEV